MTLPHRYRYLALLCALALPACSDPKAEDTDAATTTPEPTGTGSDTTPTGTTADPTDGGTTGTEPTTGEVIDPALYDQCKANDADLASVAQAQCTCLVASGSFPDMAACLAEYSASPAEADCTCTVYAKHPETKEVLDCMGPLHKAYADCAVQAACDDEAAQQQCFDTYFDAVLGCPAHPDVINSQVSIECLGETPFMCGSGEQIPESYKCDFNDDCMDGSDEAGCEGVFMCMNGSSIPDFYKCDGYLDCCEGDPECRDTSDEAGCPVFMCMDGETIPQTWQCDGEPNCMDGSDETNCPEFMCMDGETVPQSWQCDGEPDCLDGSDEADCD